ncbi:MAG: chemotaxis protein CheW [Chrysiogenia bacterium]
MSSKESSSSPVVAAEAVLSTFLLIRLNEGRFFIPLEVVGRVIKPLEVFPMPDTPEFVLGVANYSGEVLPVVDLKKVLLIPDLGGETGLKLVICRYLHVKVGFLVDDVIDACEIDCGQIKADNPKASASEFISGEFIRDRDVIGIIDVAKIITTHQAPA